MSACDDRRRENVGRVFTVLDQTRLGPRDRVAQLVQNLLTKRAIARPVGPDDDLPASGLSSLDIVNLMLSVEAEFDIKIPDREMTPANFRSIARIEALVSSLLQRLAAAG
jgi:acyl carrier protein